MITGSSSFDEKLPDKHLTNKNYFSRSKGTNDRNERELVDLNIKTKMLVW